MSKPSVFKRVMVYARQQRANQDVIETLEHLVNYLSQRQQAYFFDADTALSCPLDVPILAREELDHNQDLMIVVGGDGSMLSAARIAMRYAVPVVGINRGNLGFLTDLSAQEFILQLDQVLAGDYIRESRSFLSMRIESLTQTIEAIALNDVVLSRGNETRLIAFDVSIDDQFVSHYRADGLILATPTGSTAYALSAGGPILHPQLSAMLMVPMFSHSLSTRPLVIPGESRIGLHISNRNEAALQISCDGHDAFAIEPGQSASIQQDSRFLHLLHPKDYHYYDTLRIKLGWGSKG